MSGLPPLAFTVPPAPPGGVLETPPVGADGIPPVEPPVPPAGDEPPVDPPTFVGLCPPVVLTVPPVGPPPPVPFAPAVGELAPPVPAPLDERPPLEPAQAVNQHTPVPIAAS